MKVTFLWQASEKLQAQEVVNTGKTNTGTRQLVFDLDEISLVDRKSLLLITKIASNDWLTTIDCTRMWPVDAVQDAECGHIYASKIIHTFDEEPNLFTLMGFAFSQSSIEVLINVAYDEWKVKDKADKAAKEQARQVAHAQITQLAQDLNLKALKTTPFPDADHLFRHEAIETTAKLLFEADRDSWIGKYGSAHLIRCVEDGYDCKRLYVTERAARELPDGWLVDFDNKANWVSRSCPTPQAMQVVDEIQALGFKATVVWLTTHPHHDYDFTPTEAVVVRDWLYRYDLVKLIEETDQPND